MARARARNRPKHVVRCPACEARFELFAAPWCGCERPQRSKVCPRCRQCACETPGYQNPRLWAKAPGVFRDEGFEDLFIAYL